MKLEDMKAFAALTDEERAMKIHREELRLKAISEYNEEYFKDHQGKINCVCGDSYWSVDAEGQEALLVCFDSHGNIGSDMWDSVFISNLICVNCNGRPKAPQWWVDEYIECGLGD